MALQGLLAAMAGVALIVIGAFVEIKILVYVGIVGVATWFVLYVAAFVQIKRMNAAASGSLGTPIGFFDGPPSYQDRYRT